LTERFGHQTIVNGKGAALDSNMVEDKAEAPPRLQEETAKCRQIIDGARAVFLAQGFDAASMGEIPRQAGVSKGTLYVYFESKEELFAVIAREACRAQAETLLALDPEAQVAAGYLPLMTAKSQRPSSSIRVAPPFSSGSFSMLAICQPRRTSFMWLDCGAYVLGRLPKQSESQCTAVAGIERSEMRGCRSRVSP
jgi:AcrR family transcriptional regulator